MGSETPGGRSVSTTYVHVQLKGRLQCVVIGGKGPAVMGGPPSVVLVVKVEGVVVGGSVDEEPGPMEMLEDVAGADNVRDMVPSETLTASTE